MVAARLPRPEYHYPSADAAPQVLESPVWQQEPAVLRFLHHVWFAAGSLMLVAVGPPSLQTEAFLRSLRHTNKQS